MIPSKRVRDKTLLNVNLHIAVLLALILHTPERPTLWRTQKVRDFSTFFDFCAHIQVLRFAPYNGEL